MKTDILLIDALMSLTTFLVLVGSFVIICCSAYLYVKRWCNK